MYNKIAKMIECSEEGKNMKWIILGVVFAVVAIIRGNGIAFFSK